MIQPQTMLSIIDNSGAKIIQCFRVLGGTRKHFAQIGEIIVATVKDAEPRKSVKKHEVVRAVIVYQKSNFRRKDGTYIRFDNNSAVILEGKTKDPKGGRINGPIPREIREKGFNKIANLASEII